MWILRNETGFERTRHTGETVLMSHYTAPKSELLRINYYMHLCHSDSRTRISPVEALFCQLACLTDLFTKETAGLTESIRQVLGCPSFHVQK